MSASVDAAGSNYTALNLKVLELVFNDKIEIRWNQNQKY